MIKSHRSAAGFWFLRFWVVFALKRRFAAIYIEGLENLKNLDKSMPIIVCANHHNWWDGFFAVFLAGLLPDRKLYLLQEEKHLAKSSFFRFAGAFGINLEGSRASLPGLRHALTLLTKPDAFLWIFPEGRLTPPDVAYEIKDGAKFLARHSQANVMHVFTRLAWRENSWPSVLMKIAASGRFPQSSVAFETLRQETAWFADPSIDLAIPASLHGRKSINRSWEKLTRQKI